MYRLAAKDDMCYVLKILARPRFRVSEMCCPTSNAELDFRDGRQQAAEDDDECDCRQVEPEVVLLVMAQVAVRCQPADTAALQCFGLIACWSMCCLCCQLGAAMTRPQPSASLLVCSKSTGGPASLLVYTLLT